MDIHTSSTTEITESTSWREGPVFKTLEALRPWIQWAFIGLLALLGMYLYQRDTNAQQNVNVADVQRKMDALKETVATQKVIHDKEISEIRDKMVSKELFEERTNAIRQQVVIVDTRTVEILNRLPVRNP